MPFNISQSYPTHFLVLLGHLVLSLGALDPLATISREDMELFYRGTREECIIPEVDLSTGPFPTFALESPFSVSNTVGIYSVLKTKMEGDGSPGSVVDWKDLANLTSEIIGIFEWFRTPMCERMVRFPTVLSKKSDLLDDEVLKLISGFVENRQELVVLFDTNCPSVINILSPRASVETLRIFMTHNDGILWENQRKSIVSMKKLESRVSALETLKHLLSPGRTPPANEVLWKTQQEVLSLAKRLDTRVSTLENLGRLSFSPPEKAPLSVSSLLNCGNITCLTDPGAIGALFEGGLSDAVVACFILILS